MKMDFACTSSSRGAPKQQGTVSADADLRCYSVSSQLQTPPFHLSPMQNADLQGNRRASSRDHLLSNTEVQGSRGGTFLPCEHFGGGTHNSRGLLQSSGFCEHLHTPATADTQTNGALFVGNNSRGQGPRPACMSCHARNPSANLGLPPMPSSYVSSHSNFEQRNCLNGISAEPTVQRQRNYVNDFAPNHEQRYQPNNLSASQEDSIPFDPNSNICCQYSARNGEPLYGSLLRYHRCQEPSCLGHPEEAHPRHHEHYLPDAEASAVGNHSPGHQFANFNPHCIGSPALDQLKANMGMGSKGGAVANEATLYKWYLIRPSGSHGAEIAVGGFLSTRAMDCERVETATIVKRLEECKLLTKDGNVVNLVGSIDDFRTVSNGFPLQTVQLFISGFPHIWNLVVGMGLSNIKGMNTYSQSCDLYGGEVTSEINLGREAVKQGTCLYQPAPRADIPTSCCDNSTVNHGLEFATKEAEMAPAIVVQQHQGATLPPTGTQSNMEPLMLHEKTSDLRTQAGVCRKAERDHVKETQQEVGMEVERDHVKETQQDGSSHGHAKGHYNQVHKLTLPVCGLEDPHREDIEASIAACRYEDNAVERALVHPKKDDNEEKQAQVEAGASADVHVDNVQRGDVGPAMHCVDIDVTYDENSEKNIEPSSIRYSELDTRCMRAESTCGSVSQRRKVTFTNTDEIEAQGPSNKTANVVDPTKRIEAVPSVQASGVHKNMSEEEEVKRKGRRKEKGKYFLPKLKRSSKSMNKGQKRMRVEVARAATASLKGVSMEEGGEDGHVLDAEDVSQGMDGENVTGAEIEIISPKNSRRGEAVVPTGNAILRAANDQVGHPSSMADVVVDAGVVVKKENTKRKRKQGMQGRLGLPKSKRSRRWKQKPSNTGAKIAVKEGKASSVDGQVKIGYQERKGSKVIIGTVLQSYDSRQVEGDCKSLEDTIIKTTNESLTTESKRRKTTESKRRKSKEVDLDYDAEKSQQKKPKIKVKSESDLFTMGSTKKKGKMLLPPLPSPLVSVSKQLVSKAFGLKTSRSGRLLVPPLAHWRNQSVVRDKDGGIVAIEGISDDSAKEDTGLFNFRPPIEARAKKLQKWLSVTATECFKARQQQRAGPKQK